VHRADAGADHSDAEAICGHCGSLILSVVSCP
jgi:hypothetical protein